MVLRDNGSRRCTDRTVGVRDPGVPSAVIGPDDGLLRVEACGVCGSDVEQYRGHLVRPGMFPLIPGHEPLGVVEEVGRTGGGALGRSGGRSGRGRDPAALPACDYCLTGRYMSCPNRDGAYGMTPLSREPALWGGFADYLYLHPWAILHKVRRDLPPEIAVMFNPLGAGVRWAAMLGEVGPRRDRADPWARAARASPRLSPRGPAGPGRSSSPVCRAISGSWLWRVNSGPITRSTSIPRTSWSGCARSPTARWPTSSSS